MPPHNLMAYCRRHSKRRSFYFSIDSFDLGLFPFLSRVEALTNAHGFRHTPMAASAVKTYFKDLDEVVASSWY